MDWRWNEKVIPYWTAEAAYAQEHGVKIGFEIHPGFVVYNTETLLKLRSACGPAVGANLDPSHLFWQGMEPVEVIKVLGGEGALYDYVLSIEHEDSYLSIDEGLRRGIQTLQSIIIREPVGQMWWA